MKKALKKIGFASLLFAILFIMGACNNAPDGNGGDSGNGGDANNTTLLSSVADVRAVSSSEKVVLSWSKPSENWYGVKIAVSPSVNGFDSSTIYKDETSVLISGLSGKTEYTFIFSTVDANGNDTDRKTVITFTTPESGTSNSDSSGTVADTTPAGKVTNLTANAGNGMVSLSWKNPSDGDLYGVEITVSGGSENRAFVIKKTSETYPVYGLENGTNYTFSVKTIDNALNLSEAVTANATPKLSDDKSAPSDVTELKAEYKGSSVLLTWKDATDDDIFGYEITYKLKTNARTLSAMEKDSVFVAQGTQEYLIRDIKDEITNYDFTVKTMDLNGNKSKGSTVVVSDVKVTGVALNNITVTVAVGATATLTATIEPANATNKDCTWESSSPDVATVAQTGRVATITGVKAGNSIVRVTTKDGGKTASVIVIVEAAGDSGNGDGNGNVSHDSEFTQLFKQDDTGKLSTSNSSNVDLVLFHSSVRSQNILGGLPAAAQKHKIKMPDAGKMYVIYAVKWSDYEKAMGDTAKIAALKFVDSTLAFSDEGETSCSIGDGTIAGNCEVKFTNNTNWYIEVGKNGANDENIFYTMKPKSTESVYVAEDRDGFLMQFICNLPIKKAGKIIGIQRMFVPEWGDYLSPSPTEVINLTINPDDKLKASITYREAYLRIVNNTGKGLRMRNGTEMMYSTIQHGVINNGAEEIFQLAADKAGQKYGQIKFTIAADERKCPELTLISGKAYTVYVEETESNISEKVIDLDPEKETIEW